MHCNITKEEALGNGGNGRFFIVPGSRARAIKIADNYINNAIVKESSRGHDIYLGKLIDTEIDIGVVSTGMGCPSIDIIVTELIEVGVKHFIRIGTAGSLNKSVKKGSIVIASASVRDEGTSNTYAPIEFPAIADRNIVNILDEQAKKSSLDSQVGIVHTKDSLYSREFERGPMSKESLNYMDLLSKLGALASEMETAHLFILGSVYNVKCGAILSVIGDQDSPFGLDDKLKEDLENKTIKITIESIKKYFEKNMILNYCVPFS